MIKILFLGDISGKPGREVVAREIPKLRRKYEPDLVIANAENAAGGIGITAKVVDEITSAGIDLCTGGDHTFSNPNFVNELQGNLPFVRPANYEDQNLPGLGYDIVDLGKQGRVAVINILGRELFSYTQKVLNPFHFIDELLQDPEIVECDVKFIDFHAESTAEKLCFAWYVRDRADVVVGTHTHVATADNRIMGDKAGKVAYVSDVGQCGPYQASLWVSYETAIHNFRFPYRVKQEIELSGPRILNSVLITLDKEGQKYSPMKIDRVDVVVE